MTATQIASADHLTWVNHQLMMHGRETEARSHNLITVGDPDIAFQVSFGSAAACTAMLSAARHCVAMPLMQCEGLVQTSAGTTLACCSLLSLCLILFLTEAMGRT